MSFTNNETYFCSYDQTMQPVRTIRAATEGQPLVVSLHPWSHGYQNAMTECVEKWCKDNNWNMVIPHFRGPSWEPLSCGHDAAVQDIVDSVAFAINQFKADPERVFLLGLSGGGFHALLMAGRHPSIWKGVSAWAAISDLHAWHNQEAPQKYGYPKHIEAACNGDPNVLPAAAAAAAARSPLTYLRPNQGCLISINAGIHDGHTGSVPVSHSLNAFNALVLPEERISEQDIATITDTETIPEHLRFIGEDSTFGDKKVLFRKSVDGITITIFEGSHECVEPAAIAWLQNMADSR